VSRRNAAVVLTAAFAALAGAVAAGALSDVDQWAVRHLMPGAGHRHEQPGTLEAIVPLLHARWNGALAVAANVVTLPAGVVVSAAIVFSLSRVSGLALVAADAVELLCKSVVTRPALYDRGVHVRAFDASFPSGHALRAVIIAGAVAYVWPRYRWWAAAWAVASVALLQLAGWHTPSDLAGGVILGSLGGFGARAAGALRARRRFRTCA
jgi:membrane-associated phospholipid phosphatase